ARFFGDEPGSVPTHCVTQGLGTIMDARVIVLLATGPAKAEAVHALVEGEVSENCPASILQKHPNVVLFLNNNAAAKLENKA
ncbi:6-phosphogluconolactonase, partial [Streptococcus agalactiae]|nr:6-phosphogluconolactonase [Streptococcus agalactiae]